MQWLHEACMQLTQDWTLSPCMKWGASFLHAPPPAFPYKQPANPPLHTLGYHTGRLPLRSPSDSTLSACLVCVEALEVLTLSPLLSSSLRGSSIGITSTRRLLRGSYGIILILHFYIFFYVVEAWRDCLHLLLFFTYSAEALPKIFSLYPYFIIYTLRSHS